MIINTFMSKMGKPEDYIGKSFTNEKGEKIGIVMGCEEIDGQYYITIESQLNFDFAKPHYISFSMKGDK